MRPLILLANDDGHSAEGILQLRTALSRFADVVVCAPEFNQSATSHSLSLHRILRLRQVRPDIFALDGTPADCVYVALHSGTRVLPRRPDMIVSGMNHGLNLGCDVFYSGTVAAAREGALRGIPSMAISADTSADFPTSAALGAALVESMFHTLTKCSTREIALLNVNIPNASSWTIRSTCLGSRLYSDDVIYRQDPRGQEYLWIGGTVLRHDHVAGSDTEGFDQGVVSVTPLSLDLSSTLSRELATQVAQSTTVDS